jgi:hypothetical protein
MTQEIVQVTDFSALEDAIETWAVLGSGIPLIQKDSIDQPQAHWEGFDLDRVRPYIGISSLPQPTQGQPWIAKSKITEDTVEKILTRYFQPFKWNISFTFYTDAYDEDGATIRQQAKFYAQQLVNRAYIEPVKTILDLQKISFNPLNQTPIPGINANEDGDKYIHQATIDYRFEGIAETALKDTSFFTSIGVPTYNIEE